MAGTLFTNRKTLPIRRVLAIMPRIAISKGGSSSMMITTNHVSTTTEKSNLFQASLR